MKITVKDLSLSSKVYRVTTDSIKIVSIKSIDNDGEYINIMLNEYDWSTIQTLKDFTFFEICNMEFYLNLDDAQKRQKELRINLIGSLYKKMYSAITEYNDAIQKYFNKPLSELNNNEQEA